jgi:hypothetical protein
LIGLCFFATTKAQIVNIPDANFKAKLLAASNSNSIAKNLAGNYFKIDANSDGQIQISEALQVSYLDIVNSNVASIQGISSFSNLQFLSCVWNTIPNIDLSGLKYLQTLWAWESRITSFNFSGCNSLNYIDCGKNSITTLDVSNLTSLTTLKCSGNYNSLNINVIGCSNLSDVEVNSSMIANLNLTGLNKLQTLICGGNKLTSLDVSNLTNLTFLDCRVNQISFLDVTNLIKLQELIFYNNNLTSINVNNLTNLTNFWGDSNKLSFLDLTNCINLQSLSCSYNQLTTLMMKNGINETYNYINGNPNLNYICCDEFEKSEIKIIANPNCEINSYCSFVPGGTYYNIQGNSKFDYNADGCDVLDYNYSNLKFRVINGSIDTFSIPNGSGFYNIPVQAGAYTITPKLENPTYFNVSPTTVSVTFPTQTSPFVQNYCITANGVHPDLEITLLPLQPARPGSDSNYKIVYKNKGNQAQSGSVNLTFDDAVLDLVVANPATTTQTKNNLSWDFTNLLPFETREITFTLNVNSPMETPAVIGGAILAYKATITSPATDDTPIDNTFAFNQIVVNSFDPNDKTCLEGTTISPSLIGQYVHYMIRFENSGTANARNIVVKDMIDLSKFDISTLVPTNASHSFVTNITAGNKVEFIFENINLPFDDANNDGYIAFKIKTLPTLKVGDTFTNDASIYFDYNFPIVTKLASSTFKTLGTQDFEFSSYFTIYPNPAKEVLNIIAKETIEVQSMSVYNTLGQLVLVIPNAEKVSKIDVSSLTTGNYFIKINSDKGTSNTRFIKE